MRHGFLTGFKSSKFGYASNSAPLALYPSQGNRDAQGIPGVPVHRDRQSPEFCRSSRTGRCVLLKRKGLASPERSTFPRGSSECTRRNRTGSRRRRTNPARPAQVVEKAARRRMKGCHEKATPSELTNWLALESAGRRTSRPIPSKIRECVVDALRDVLRGQWNCCSCRLDTDRRDAFHIGQFRPQPAFPALSVKRANLIALAAPIDWQERQIRLAGTLWTTVSPNPVASKSIFGNGQTMSVL